MKTHVDVSLLFLISLKPKTLNICNESQIMNIIAPRVRSYIADILPSPYEGMISSNASLVTHPPSSDEQIENKTNKISRLSDRYRIMKTISLNSKESLLRNVPIIGLQTRLTLYLSS